MCLNFVSPTAEVIQLIILLIKYFPATLTDMTCKAEKPQKDYKPGRNQILTISAF